MLRSKQIGTLSQCARSFVLANTTSSSADRTKCSCPKDETCAPRRHAQRNSTRIYQNRSPKVKSNLPAGIVGSKVACLNVISASNCTNAKSLTSTSKPEGEADSGCHSMVNTPQMVSGHFLNEVGTSVLSEFVRHNIPATEVSSSYSSCWRYGQLQPTGLSPTVYLL